MYFSFTNPSYLILLVVLPFIIFFHFYSLKHLKGKSLRFANFESIAKIKGIDLYSKNLLTLFFNLLIVSIIIFAASGLTLHKEMQGTDFSYVIAIDTSQSMGATDILPDRISAAKQSASDFVDSTPANTKIAVITYSGNTVVEHDLSENKEDLKNSIKNIQIKDTGGTDLYDAISIAYNLLKNEDNRAIIIMSDGQINVGNMKEIVDYSVFNKVIVYTIGIGTLYGGKTAFGVSKLDEDSLKSIAYSTKGKYFKVGNQAEMEAIFSQIIPLTKKIGSINMSTYLLISAIILFVFEQFIAKKTAITI